MQLSTADLQHIHKQISSYIHYTPLLQSQAINEITGANLYFKCENFQKVGAFKARGATRAVLQLDKSVTEVYTHSSGNHAQALAYAAKATGRKAHIVMPENAPKVKVEAVKGYGAEITLCQPTQQARHDTADKIVQETGAAFIHPYNYIPVIEGQATVAKEIFDSIKPDLLVAPVGGGGLMSGSILATQALSPNTHVFGVEPSLCNDAKQSITTNSLQPTTGNKSIADGLLTSLGDITFPIIKNGVSDIFEVSEKEIVEALKLIWQRLKIVVEPSSATVLAAVLQNKDLFKNKTVALVVTGGNVDINFHSLWSV